MTSRPAAWEPFELAVFDCDGVLVDSERISVRVDQRVLADLGWALGLEEIVQRFVGRSEAHFIAAVEQQLGIELAGPGTTVFHDMRELPELIAAGRPLG